MPEFNIEQVKKGILCCISISIGSCKECPYYKFNEPGKIEWEESCQYYLEKDIDEVFLRFKLSDEKLD